MNFSSNINEVIRAVLNPLWFFYKNISHATKAQKAEKAPKHQKYKKHKNPTNQKYKTLQANKNKKCTEKHLRRKK